MVQKRKTMIFLNTSREKSFKQLIGTRFIIIRMTDEFVMEGINDSSSTKVHKQTNYKEKPISIPQPLLFTLESYKKIFKFKS